MTQDLLHHDSKLTFSSPYWVKSSHCKTLPQICDSLCIYLCSTVFIQILALNPNQVLFSYQFKNEMHFTKHKLHKQTICVLLTVQEQSETVFSVKSIWRLLLKLLFPRVSLLDFISIFLSFKIFQWILLISLLQHWCWGRPDARQWQKGCSIDMTFSFGLGSTIFEWYPPPKNPYIFK